MSLVLLCLLLLAAVNSAAFTITRSSHHQLSPSIRQRQLQLQSNDNISVEKYKHKNFTLTYLYKEPSPGRENDRPIILIHPVGIGLSSWFWNKILETYVDNNPPIYCPDLIGCGINHGADAWDPETNGLFFPLSWVEGIETLLNTISAHAEGGCLVVTQGGLAPVGIMLAKRNPKQIGTLMLTSPNTYEDITTPIPQKELQRNYDFLRSPILGNLAFALLESRQAIKFFSDLFLFQDTCDEQWLDEAMDEICDDARAPVQVFNAGLLQHRSYEDELNDMSSRIWIVKGTSDKRDRQMYISKLGDEKCKLVTLDGCNVLPWENPVSTINLMRELGY